MEAPAPPPLAWHPVTQKAREEAEGPRARLEAERMGSALAKMQTKDVKKKGVLT
jgi:hypothetical protein